MFHSIPKSILFDKIILTPKKKLRNVESPFVKLCMQINLFH